ncbi:MAG: contact-dependent growth inhibition system immunity protein [Fimbriiglobus sp.]
MEKYPLLEQLFGAYFHQDAFVDGEDAPGIIDIYLSDCNGDSLHKHRVALELNRLLEDQDYLENPEDFLYHLGSYYYANADYNNTTEFILMILDKLCKSM